MPRTYQFNKVCGLDTFEVVFQGRKVHFLNVVCHGTNYQSISLLEELTAKEVWRHFSRDWIRIFGPSEIAITDGGSEFLAEFERKLEQQGVLQQVTDAYSPWQNGRCERHGAWNKDILEAAIASRCISSLSELELLSHEVAAAKNRYLHRGGFSPYQLVFGQNPRLPNELLSDDGIDVVGTSDLSGTAGDQDSVAAEYAREHFIRSKA